VRIVNNLDKKGFYYMVSFRKGQNVVALMTIDGRTGIMGAFKFYDGGDFNRMEDSAKGFIEKNRLSAKDVEIETRYDKKYSRTPFDILHVVTSKKDSKQEQVLRATDGRPAQAVRTGKR